MISEKFNYPNPAGENKNGLTDMEEAARHILQFTMSSIIILDLMLGRWQPLLMGR